MGVRGKSSGGGHNKREEAVAVAIDKDKGSQHAIKWTVDNLLTRGQALTLLHVKHPTISSPPAGHGTDDAGKVHINPTDTQSKELFLPFRCYCTKKAIRCNEVIIEDFDISRALLNYVNNNQMEILVLGAPSKSGIFRYKDLYAINSKFMTTDVPSTVSKKAPEFCSVYVISRGKISFMRSASTSVPRSSSSTSNQIEHQSSKVSESNDAEIMMRNNKMRALERTHYQSERMQHTHERNQFSPRILLQEDESIMSPFSRGKHAMNKTFELPPDSDISFVSSGSPRMERAFTPFYESMSSLGSRNSNYSEMESRSSTASYSGTKFIDMSSSREFSSSSFDSVNSWSSSDDVEAEMRRLRLELKQTREMYSTACKEAVTAKHKVKEVDRWKLEEEMRLEEVRVAEGAALAAIEKEKARCKAAIEAAEAAHRVAELEAQKRRHAELNAIKDTEQRMKAVEGRSYDIVRYRKYSIEDIEAATFNFSKDFKIGEGGYGPVYKGELDHTAVAIKILRPDAAHGQSQFRQEVEVLSCIRHPNMVLLLGACPEYGCLVYEYMANGSLEDRLFRRGNTPAIPWQIRFRIAAEIGTGLLFLHQTKPEPLVHRDLKPGNILLDHNYVSKISDVGLARLVPPSVANNVTQYRMTSTAGTFCYIDPEYQQTGMLGVKSDVYSLGVLLLQIITARPPMGLTHYVEEAIETGTFAEMLDPTVSDWPVEEALSFAKLALQCAEMRRRDRPDLGKVVLTELNRLKELSQDSMNRLMFGGCEFSAKQAMMSSSSKQDVMSDSNLTHPEYDSQSSTSSHPGR